MQLCVWRVSERAVEGGTERSLFALARLADSQADRQRPRDRDRRYRIAREEAARLLFPVAPLPYAPPARKAFPKLEFADVLDVYKFEHDLFY